MTSLKNMRNMSMPSEFITVPAMGILSGKRGWQLAGDLVYRSESLQRLIVVPKGFQTDLASVPKIAPAFIVDVANGPSRLPAITHDYLCYSSVQERMGITQAQADKVFREALKAVGMGFWKRTFVLWLPVRLFQFATSWAIKQGEPPIATSAPE